MNNYDVFSQYSNEDKVNAYREFSMELLNSYWINHAIECEQSKDIDALAYHLMDTYIESDEDYAYEQLINIIKESKVSK